MADLANHPEKYAGTSVIVEGNLLIQENGEKYYLENGRARISVCRYEEYVKCGRLPMQELLECLRTDKTKVEQLRGLVGKKIKINGRYLNASDGMVERYELCDIAWAQSSS